jgi:hypothetical protein
MTWEVPVPIRCTAISTWETYFRIGPPKYPITWPHRSHLLPNMSLLGPIGGFVFFCASFSTQVLKVLGLGKRLTSWYCVTCRRCPLASYHWPGTGEGCVVSAHKTEDISDEGKKSCRSVHGSLTCFDLACLHLQVQAHKQKHSPEEVLRSGK